jgi:hypothetical protein
MVLWPWPDCKRVTACWHDLPADEVLSMFGREASAKIGTGR